MFHDLRSSRPPAFPPDSVVVVGSGAAGLALALELAKVQPVVLLESGGDVSAPDAIADSRHLNVGVIEEQHFEGLEVGRARVLGGTTQLWHGQCMRLHELDLRARPWVANSGWPLAPAELDTYYVQAERWLDVSGRGYDERRWSEHPGLTPLAWDPRHLEHDFTEYMRRPYLGTEHRSALLAHDNVHVLLHATAARVLLEGTAVAGVEVCAPDGVRLTVPAARVVLAAGAIENARLLQLSDKAGVGLGTGREHTGRYLQDHPIIRTAEVFPRSYPELQDRYVTLRRRGRRLFPKVRLAAQAQQELGLLDATAVFVHDHDSAAMDAAHRLAVAARRRALPPHALREVALAARAGLPLGRAVYRRYAKGLSTGARPSHVWLQVWTEQAPDPSRRVSLAADRDAYGLRRASVRWTCEPQELETSRVLTRYVAQDLDRLGIARVRELPAMWDDAAWRAEVTDAAHPSGTTRMARSPEHGVVDPDLQVHGVEGLYVVGGSVFPASGYANPTLTIVALALRLAAHLRLREAVRVA